MHITHAFRRDDFVVCGKDIALFKGGTEGFDRINAYALGKDVTDNKSVNCVLPKDECPVPFDYMVYFGDGDTDVACISMIKRFGSYCVALYLPHDDKL